MFAPEAHFDYLLHAASTSVAAAAAATCVPFNFEGLDTSESDDTAAAAALAIVEGAAEQGAGCLTSLPSCLPTCPIEELLLSLT